MSVLIVIFGVFIYESKFIKKIFVFLNNKSLSDNILNDVIDYKNGTTLRIVCDDAIYTGRLVGHEENEKDSLYLLKDYIVEENDGSYCSKDMTYKSTVAINISKAKRIELYYNEHDNSKGKFRKCFNRKNNQDNLVLDKVISDNKISMDKTTFDCETTEQ